MNIDIDSVKDYLQDLQMHITNELQQLDGKASFEADAWQRDARDAAFFRAAR